MGLVSMKEILDDALKNHYTVCAFNALNPDMLVAILEAAEEEDSPIIVQLCSWTHDYVNNYQNLVNIFNACCETYTVPIAFNHDHCPTVEGAKKALDYGIKSVMFDGSHLPFEENIKQTKEVVEYAHARNAFVEAELGNIPGFEDQVFAAATVLTNPAMAKEFVERTQCDSLAISVGTAHGGVATEEHLPIHFDLLEEIARTIPNTPLVLHGAASLPAELFDKVNQWGGQVPQMRICSEEDISKCGQYHVCKANMDVDNFMVYMAEIRRNVLTKPEEYNPKAMLDCARLAMKEEVRHKLRNVGQTSGRNWMK